MRAGERIEDKKRAWNRFQALFLQRGQRILRMSHRLTGYGIKEEFLEVRAGEVEHVVERSGQRVKGLVTDATSLPVVLDEAQDGRLVGHGVVNEVRAGIRRDNQHRQARAVAATSLVSPSSGGTAHAR